MRKLRIPVIIAVAILVTLASYKYGQIVIDPIKDFARDYPFLGPLIIILVYAVSAVLLIPGSVLTIFCGTAFGLFKGTVIVVIASNLGALFAYIMAKTLLRRRVQQWMTKYPRLNKIYDALERHDFKIVLLLRLSPIFPYTLLNYFMGVAKVRPLSYVVASLTGMLPGTFLYVYIGVIGAEVAGGEVKVLKAVLYAVGLAATVAATIVIARIARRALSNATDLGDIS